MGVFIVSFGCPGQYAVAPEDTQARKFGNAAKLAIGAINGAFHNDMLWFMPLFPTLSRRSAGGERTRRHFDALCAPEPRSQNGPLAPTLSPSEGERGNRRLVSGEPRFRGSENRSALEWVIDQYQVSTDKRSGITNDPNRPDDPQYILRLIAQVITVSLETMKIVKSLPPMQTN
jgi:hypothetical protein